MKNALRNLTAGLMVLALLGPVAGTAEAKGKKKKQTTEDPYAEYVWPPPPDPPRIKLEAVVSSRYDVETKSRFKRKLAKLSGKEAYSRLSKPIAVAFDPQGRILVTDWAHGALFRFDVSGGRMDVLGTQGAIRLERPLGLTVGPDGIIYVADPQQTRVVSFDAEGKVVNVYGGQGDLVRPTDVTVSPDGKQLFVADSKGQKIVVFDREGGGVVRSFGRAGSGDGEFNYPTSLTFGPEGELFVVDQLNARVQVFAADGVYIDEFGELGTGYGNFVRPKDIVVDEVGLIYVTDNAFNNVQLFDADFTVLTFVGQGGEGPGRFKGASGVAVQGERFAVVDQLGARVQVFRFLIPKDS